MPWPAALYLTAYYLGASLLGTTSGYFWVHDQWRGIVAALVVVLFAGLAVTVWRLRPLR